MHDAADAFDCDVIIVGGGPVGLGLTIDLAQRGVDVELLERSAKLHDIPKGQNLTQRTGEHFRAWNVLDEIEAATPIPRSFGNAGLVAFGKLLGDYHYDWFKRGSVADYYFARNQRLPQYETEKVLRKRVAQFGKAAVRYGVKATGIAQDESGVEVAFQLADDGGTGILRARYVVGCDGSRSLVRDAAGIAQDVDPHDRKMVLLVFNSPQLHELLERFPGKSIYNVLNPDLNGYWQFLGRVDLEGNWFYHAPVPGDATLDNFDFVGHLHEAVGAHFEIDFRHIGFWDLRIAMATTYRSERLFIAGDAAHSHPPYGGYGVNTGLEDARNLSWKLGAILGGWGNEALLDSYDAERRPVFASTWKDFIGRMIEDDRQFALAFSPEADREAFEHAWQERAAGGNADVTQFLPHYSGSPVVSGNHEPSGARGEHLIKARAGHHLAPMKLSNDRDLFDELGSDFALIILDGDEAATGCFAKAAHDLDLPLRIIVDDLADGRTAYEARYILVRPDHFIAWRSDVLPENPGAVLGSAIGKSSV